MTIIQKLEIEMGRHLFVLILVSLLTIKLGVAQLLPDTIDRKEFHSLTKPTEKLDGIGTFSDTTTAIRFRDTLLVVAEYTEGLKTNVSAWYKNGNPSWVVHFNEFGLHGARRIYHPNGQLKRLSFSENGNPMEPTFEWYENGQLERMIQTYPPGSKTGTKITNWYESGALYGWSKNVQLNNFPDAVESQLFYENGNVMDKEIVNAGKQLKQSFYENGNKLSEGFIDGVESFKLSYWKEWYENGNLKLQSSYSDSIPNHRVGTWEWYDENGKLRKVAVFKDDVLVSEQSF